MNYKTNNINRFLKISLDSADLVETFDVINPFTDELGLGRRIYTEYIRQGVKEVIDLKQENMVLTNNLEFTKDLLRKYREIITLDINDLTDENKEKIKRFCEELLDEVEEWTKNMILNSHKMTWQ